MSDDNETAVRAPLAWKPVLAIACAAVFVHLTAATGYGIFRDELYYLACARHLDWGYVDQPPFSLAVLALIRAIFGESLWALRTPPAILSGITAIMVAANAREIGGGKWAQALAAFGFLIAPTSLGSFGFYSMNAWDVFFWSVGGWLFLRLIRTGDAGLWIPFGVVAGIGLQNKFSMAFFGFGVVAALLLTRQRRHFLRPQLYIGGLIAFVIYLPNIVWQFTHDFAMLEFMRNASLYKNAFVPPHLYLLLQIVEFHPLNAVLWTGGLIFAIASPRGAAWRPVAVLFIAVFFLLACTHGKTYYLGPAYTLALPLGALAFEHATRARGAWRRVFATALVIGGIVTLPMGVAVLPAETFLRYQDFIGLRPGGSSSADLFPQHFGDRFGWPEMAACVADAYRQLPAEDRAKCGILTSNYGEAGAIDYYGPALGLPPAVSGHNNYYLWGPRGATGEVMLLVLDTTKEALENYYTSVAEVARTRHPYAVSYESNRPIFVCRGLKIPMALAWPQLKKYI